MTPQQWQTIAELVDWLDDANGRSEHEISLRLAKLSEELGEFAHAVHYSLRDDAAAELLDVQLTAAVALRTLDPDAGTRYAIHHSSFGSGGVSRDAEGLLAQLAMDVGRVVQARIGMVGQNPRKGHSHSVDDVADALCTVIRHAEEGLGVFVAETYSYTAARFRAIAERVLPNLEAEATR